MFLVLFDHFMVFIIVQLNILFAKQSRKSACFAGTFSSHASRASLSAPRARDLFVALRAPFFLDLAIHARSCALRILII